MTWDKLIDRLIAIQQARDFPPAWVVALPLGVKDNNHRPEDYEGIGRADPFPFPPD
jgi:hypothetical protein